MNSTQKNFKVTKRPAFFESHDYYPIILMPDAIKADLNLEYSSADIAMKYNIACPKYCSPPTMKEPSKFRTVQKKKINGRYKTITEEIPKPEYDLLLKKRLELITKIQNKVKDEFNRKKIPSDFSIIDSSSIVKSSSIFNISYEEFNKNLVTKDLKKQSGELWSKYNLVKEEIEESIDFEKKFKSFLTYMKEEEYFENRIAKYKSAFEQNLLKEKYLNRFTESNHQRISDLPIKGSSELLFLVYLNNHFSNFIDIDCKLGEYYPDFLYYNNASKIKIDIEIDEMICQETKFPIHEIGGRDEARNNYFLCNNWIVIRFTENQVKDYPNECCDIIQQVINNLSNPFSQPNIEINFQKTKRWTYVEATLNKK